MTDATISKITALQYKLSTTINRQTQIDKQATKLGYVMPLLSILGYDIFNNEEVIPNYQTSTSANLNSTNHSDDIADLVVCLDSKPRVVIDIVPLGEKPTRTTLQQLEKHYNNINATVGIVTNGEHYWFFEDKADKSSMNTKPVYKLNVSTLDVLEKSDIAKLEEYEKENIKSKNKEKERQLQMDKTRVIEASSDFNTANTGRTDNTDRQLYASHLQSNSRINTRHLGQDIH